MMRKQVLELLEENLQKRRESRERIMERLKKVDANYNYTVTTL